MFAPVFTSDGATVFTPSQDGSARLGHRGKSPPCTPFTFAPDGTPGVQGQAFSPDGKTVAIGVGGKISFSGSRETRTQVGDPVTVPTEAITSVAFNPDGRTLAVGDAGNAFLVDVESRSVVGTARVAGTMATFTWRSAPTESCWPPAAPAVGSCSSMLPR